MKSTNSDNILGIDIGTNYLRACIHNDQILEFIKYPSAGIQAGNIINSEEFANSLLKLVNKVKKKYQIKDLKIIFGLASSSLNSGYLNISVPINNNNSKVGNNELKAIETKNEDTYDTHGLVTLYHSVRKYRVNGTEIKNSPLGVMGSRLDARVFSIFVDKSQITMLEDVCKKLKIKILEIFSSPLLEADLILSNKQKLSGVALLHIGNASSSLLVYENYSPIAAVALPFGTQTLDNEIALNLKVSLEEAYEIRMGNLLTGFNKKKYEKILDNTLNSWTDKVNEELDIIKRKELLPSGLLILGEVCNNLTFEAVFKTKMKLPIKLEKKIIEELKTYNISSGEWFRPLALAIADTHREYNTLTIKIIYNHIKDIVCQFLP